MAKENSEKPVHAAIKLLRQKKLEQGLPFMINTEILDSKQCFMEYPDGSIKLVEADPHTCDFRILHEYKSKDANRLRKKLNLI